MEKNFVVRIRHSTLCKNISATIFYSLGLIFFLASSPAFAQSNVSITANVLSGVSSGVSTFVSDILQLPADGKSVVVLTATILSKEGQALPNKETIVSSNRGEVDTILCYLGSTLTNKHAAITDSEGKVRCVASSEVPGNATFTAVAEGVTLDNKPTVTFTPLPFLTNLTIKVNLPGGAQLTILEPVKPKPSKPANERLVNTDVELQIPFWVMLAIVMLLLTEPFLIILVLRLSRKVRHGFEAEKQLVVQEKEYLAKIYQLEQSVNAHTATTEAKTDQIASQLRTSIQQQTEIKETIDQATQPPTNIVEPPPS